MDNNEFNDEPIFRVCRVVTAMETIEEYNLTEGDFMKDYFYSKGYADSDIISKYFSKQ